MPSTGITSYGFLGSHEFNVNRKEILDAYFLAKQKAENRPVKTEHGGIVDDDIKSSTC